MELVFIAFPLRIQITFLLLLLPPSPPPSSALSEEGKTAVDIINDCKKLFVVLAALARRRRRQFSHCFHLIMPTRINGSEAAATPAKLAPLSVNNHATAAAASGEKNANQKNKKAVNGSGSNRSEKPTKSSTPRRRKHRGRRPTSPIKKDEFGRSASARRPDPPKKSGGSNPVPRSSSAPRRKISISKRI
jgi:hypothetical protein